MVYLNGFYLNNPHVSQFDGSTYQGANCTPTSGANGVNSVTGGRRHPTGGTVRTYLRRSEETSPATPGWSMPDLHTAMGRYGVPFQNRSSFGWDQLVKDHKAGMYLAIQGDSEEFSNSTCSGKFNGDHCIGASPSTKFEHDDEWWWIDDPICPTGRWERRKVIYEYARNLAANMWYGMFMTPVPRAPVNLWGADVPARLRVINPTGWTVGQAIIEAKGTYGTSINMSDLRGAFAAINHDYGKVVDVSDIQFLVDWAKTH